MYTDVRIEHSATHQQVTSSMETWCRDREGFMKYKLLQGKDVECIGWLLYSTREMSVENLIRSWSLEMGCPVNFRWKTIRYDDPNKKVMEDWRKRPAALHVECNRPDMHRLKTEIKRVYRRKANSDWPFGIKMRFVQEQSTMKNGISRQKTTQLVDFQTRFLQAVCTKTAQGILAIDREVASTGKTIRQMIMEVLDDD